MVVERKGETGAISFYGFSDVMAMPQGTPALPLKVTLRCDLTDQRDFRAVSLFMFPII